MRRFWGINKEPRVIYSGKGTRMGTIDVKERVGRVCDNVRLRRCRHRMGWSMVVHFWVKNDMLLLVGWCEILQFAKTLGLGWKTINMETRFFVVLVYMT